MSTALIADIRRLTIHDGPGTRDTVFVKGCPLHCIWCHNPESISPHTELLFHEKLCIRCGECLKVCPQKVHTFENGRHLLDRSKCLNCGKCAENCFPGALVLCGKRMTVQEVFDSVMHDRDFFVQLNGGVTLSGGEGLFYPDFAAELFKLLKEAEIHTALDSCGNVSFSAFEKVLPHTDLILYDMKGMDPGKHARNTGCGNSLILENLAGLGKGKIPIEIRMPVVPGSNDDPEEIEKAGLFLKDLPSVRTVRLLAYHAMAREKYKACGRADTMPHAETPSRERLESLAELLKKTSRKEVIY